MDNIKFMSDRDAVPEDEGGRSTYLKMFVIIAIMNAVYV